MHSYLDTDVLVRALRCTPVCFYTSIALMFYRPLKHHRAPDNVNTALKMIIESQVWGAKKLSTVLSTVLSTYTFRTNGSSCKHSGMWTLYPCSYDIKWQSTSCLHLHTSLLRCYMIFIPNTFLLCLVFGQKSPTSSRPKLINWLLKRIQNPP